MLNFDWRKLKWFIEWIDSKYNKWGSPTCPEEKHSHIGNQKHHVNYQSLRAAERYFRGK